MCPNTSSNFEKSTKNWKNNFLSWNTFWACKKIFQHKCSKNLVKFWRKGEKSKNQTKWKNLEKFGKIRKNSEKNGKIQKNFFRRIQKKVEKMGESWKNSDNNWRNGNILIFDVVVDLGMTGMVIKGIPKEATLASFTNCTEEIAVRLVNVTNLDGTEDDRLYFMGPSNSQLQRQLGKSGNY